MLVKNGQADVTTYFVLRDSTNHAPKTDVTITDIDLYYVKDLAAISAVADATALAAADSAHADNKAFHVGQGMYRIDWPDEAFNGGIGKKVQLIVVCTGVDTTFLEVDLSAPADAVAVSGDATAADRLEATLDAMPSGAVVDDNDPDPTTLLFETNLSEATNDHYNGAFVVFTSGALLGQSRKISDYDGTTKVLTVAAAFTDAPTAADTFIILGRSE
jgi:chitodextrinase